VAPTVVAGNSITTSRNAAFLEMYYASFDIDFNHPFERSETAVDNNGCVRKVVSIH